MIEKVVSVVVTVIVFVVFFTLIFGHYPGRDVLDQKYYTTYQKVTTEILIEKGYSEKEAISLAETETQRELWGTAIAEFIGLLIAVIIGSGGVYQFLSKKNYFKQTENLKPKA